MLKTMIIAAALAAVAGTAGAQSWTTFGSSDGLTYQYDPATVQRSGGSVSVQTRVLYDPPQAYDGAGGGTAGEISEMLEHTSYDCSAHTYVDEGLTAKSASGATLYSQGPQPAKPIESGSSAALYASSLCS